MKRIIAISLASLLVLAVGAGCSSKPATSAAPAAPAASSAAPAAPAAPAKSAEQIFINIATGGTGGTYYPLGGAFAEIWNNNIKGFKMNATVQSTGGSVANTNMLKNKEVEFILVQNDVCYYAQEGIILFDQKFPEIRGVMSMFTEPIQLVATASSKIESVEDLRGKTVALGPIGSGSEACARQVLKAAGIDPEKDIKPKFISFNDAAVAMKDRQIDAALIVVGAPAGAITDLATSIDIKLVKVGGASADNLFKEYSYYVPYQIPANSYKGQTEAVDTVAIKAITAVRDDFDADLLYEMLETLYANKDRVVNAHTTGKQIIEETALDGMSIPLHPGAEKFFKDKGVLK
jgi:TRAP transporter TAXI family solute receptor